MVGEHPRHPDQAPASARRLRPRRDAHLPADARPRRSSAPTALIAAASFLAGVGLSVHLTLWFTVFQQQVPEHAQSRVASYDTLGSFVLMPIGCALVGPLADAIGIVETLWIALVVMWASWAAILAAAVRLGDPAVAAVPAPSPA